MTVMTTKAPATDSWQFYRDDERKWRWTYSLQGKTAARAYVGFERYGDCVDDARRHGYRGKGEKS